GRENALKIRADIRVRRSDRRISSMGIQFVSNRVFGNIMRVAIDFDDQPLLRTKEIHDATPDHMLAAKLVSAELRSAQVTPELRFDGISAAAQSFCATEQMRVLRQPVPQPFAPPLKGWGYVSRSSSSSATS